MKRCLTSFLLLPFAAIAAKTNDLPKLVPAYGELSPTFWEQHQAAIIIASFAFLAFVFLFVKTMLRPESPKILSPETVARQALAKLQGQPEDGKLLSEVSQILRRYISAAFELPAAELTTAEFCAALVANEKIGAELAGTISDFLRECDERKFSPAVRSSAFTRPGPPEGGTPNILPLTNTAARALELIARSEKCLSLVGRASSRAGSETVGSSAASPHQRPVK